MFYFVSLFYSTPIPIPTSRVHHQVTHFTDTGELYGIIGRISWTWFPNFKRGGGEE